MIRLYVALTVGHFRRHRLEFLLCVLGVALGVAVAVAIDAAVGACVGSFRGAVQSLAERSTHSIFPEEGTIADESLIALMKKRLPYPLAPVIDRVFGFEEAAEAYHHLEARNHFGKVVIAVN